MARLSKKSVAHFNKMLKFHKGMLKAVKTPEAQEKERKEIARIEEKLNNRK